MNKYDRIREQIDRLQKRGKRYDEIGFDAAFSALYHEAANTMQQLLEVAEAAEKASQFRFCPTFDAKGTYTKRKRTEWTDVSLPLKAALVKLENSDA